MSLKATRITLLESTALTADGQGLVISVPTITMAIVGVNITAVSGSTPVASFILQCSSDGGTTWYDMPCDQRLKVSTGTTDVTAATFKRNIVDAETGVDQWLAVFKHLPSDKIRLRWVITGTTPSFTTVAALVGK